MPEMERKVYFIFEQFLRPEPKNGSGPWQIKTKTPMHFETDGFYTFSRRRPQCRWSVYGLPVVLHFRKSGCLK